MYTVYVIRSTVANYLYVGLTNSIERRLKQHQGGKERTTRSYRPFKLVHTETFEKRIHAREREKQLKSGSGKEWLKDKISKNSN
ncbi:MAG: GIY-YIG nuclease family protein [Candidatus Peribacteraceae bacterium]